MSPCQLCQLHQLPQLCEQTASDLDLNYPSPREALRSVHSRPVLWWTGSSWTGIHSDLNSCRTCGSAGLLSELMAWDVPEDVRFPEEMAAVVKLWEPSPAQLSAVVRLSEPAPAQLDFTAEEPSLLEEEVAWPEAWFTAVQFPREPAPAEPPILIRMAPGGTVSRVFICSSPVPSKTDPAGRSGVVQLCEELAPAGPSPAVVPLRLHDEPTPAGPSSAVVRFLEEPTPAGGSA